MPTTKTIALVAGIACSASGILPARANDGALPPDPLGELRRGFTLGGSPVPPLVFRDMGDGNAADLKPLLVTVDAWAAIGSNRYGDDIRRHDGWVSQTARVPDQGGGSETESYRYLGATPEGLLAVLTADSSADAAFAPTTLRVLGSGVTRAFDADGRRYDRVDVTVLAAYPLGDRWTGEATLSGDTVTVVTKGGASGPDQASGSVRTYRIVPP